MTARSGSVASGSRIGRYEVESFLGAGGMGEVYVARDSTLGRRVALKLLPRECSPERIARFVREAQASSALNHPSIVSVYDAGSADGTQFLAMELIDGESLSAWMHSRRNTDRAVELLAQVADGLARAHAAGIVHRDLKPDNIMVSRDGYAKVVDFGIAKLTERDVDVSGDTALKTASGSVIGTAPYMSPEQVDGRDVDYRSDIFSFGTVLYEAVTGIHPFAGSTSVETLHNITHRDAPLDKVPARFRRIVRRCLAREPEDRYQSMKDVAHDLRDVDDAAPAPAKRKIRPWFAVVAALVVLGAMALLWARRGSLPGIAATRPAMRMQRVTNTGKVSAAAVSPDGNYVLYALRDRGFESLWVKQLSTGTARRINEPVQSNYQQIIVSPDGNYVYYCATAPGNNNRGQIFQIPILGGEARMIADDTEFAFAVSPDGKRIAFRRINLAEGMLRLTICDADTSAQQVILTRQLPSVMYPLWWASSDASTIAFVAGAPQTPRRIEEISIATGKVSVVRTIPFRGGILSAWPLPDDGGLLVAAAEPEQPPQIWLLPRSGEPRKITSDLSAYSSITSTADGGIFTAQRGEGTPSISVLQRTSNGTAVAVASGLGTEFNASGVNPANAIATGFIATRGITWLDASHVIYTGIMAAKPTLFSASTAGGEPRPLVRGIPGYSPAITNDGKTVLFVSMRKGSPEIWAASADGSNPRQLTESGGAGNPVASPDGRWVYYGQERTGNFIARVPLAGGPSQQVTTFPARFPNLSPDGKLLLCRMRWAPDGAPPEWRTGILDAETGKLIRFAKLPRAGGPQIRFHPTTGNIVAVDSFDGVQNLWEEDIKSGELRQITNFATGVIYAFDWSRDGKSIGLLHGDPRNDVVLVRDFR